MRPPKKFRPEPFPYHHELTLCIDSLTNLGMGVARVDGWVVFVPYCLPGETVKAKVYRNEKNYSLADLVEVIEASPDRVAPQCPLFTECGGCQYQHFSYPAQLAWKTRQVEELMKHMAGMSFPVNPCHPSPQQWGYRSKITPHYQKPRDTEEFMPIGFLAQGRRSQILDVPQCPIAMQSINLALPAVREKTRCNPGKKGGTLLLRATVDEAGNRQVETDNNAIVTEVCGSLRYDFLAGEFFQNNPFILQEFVGYVEQQACLPETKFLIDAYCGSGLFALALAKHFEKIAAVEVSEAAINWARKNAAKNGITNASFLAASAEAIFADITFPAAQTTVVIDPPRKGCTQEFLDQLIAFRPRRVVYVSCDPATQVRDLAILRDAGFTLAAVQPFDLFPHTRHVENIMTFDGPI
ncbi:MAG TPA: SAM-dependent methyltransferase [Verrucomicrobiales bacterium]|nr:MAG: SAM-dependent methyltransferase [Verrucomicrobiae bacterium Tous-C3TDCM]PAZ04957.1 MAG: SAM-dependent methyltransferase [Verrucomicrobiae bacterium AMD-G2]HBE23037.1 SAM-dependent methyltransferase [Verrucomicrobiales bacterium]